MAKNNGKVLENIEKVLGLVGEGVYGISEGKLLKGDRILKGSIGSEDGQQWYSVKGMNIQGQKLMYAFYNGIDSLINNPDHVVKHMDGDKLNNKEGNLILLPRKGWKEGLEEARKMYGMTMPGKTATAPAQATTELEPTATWNEKEQEARKIWMELYKGKTMKEVAYALGVKPQRVYDVKRRKTNRKATEQLPELG